MESQRYWEDCRKPLNDSDYKKLEPFKEHLELLRNIRTKRDGLETNSGWCLVLCGRAATYKTTANLILAQSHGKYHVWTGHQYIERDILKYDDAARASIEQIVVEDMTWTSLLHKKTLDDTLCSIKEQLSGAGPNIRLAKNKTSLEGLKLVIKRFYMSYNPTDIIDFQVLKQKIDPKMEFKRRFYLINFDSLELANVFARPKAKWDDSLIPLAAKCIATPQAWKKFQDYIEGIEEIGSFYFCRVDDIVLRRVKSEFLEQDLEEGREHYERVMNDQMARKLHREDRGEILPDEDEPEDDEIL